MEQFNVAIRLQYGEQGAKFLSRLVSYRNTHPRDRNRPRLVHLSTGTVMTVSQSKVEATAEACLRGEAKRRAHHAYRISALAVVPQVPQEEVIATLLTSLPEDQDFRHWASQSERTVSKWSMCHVHVDQDGRNQALKITLG